MISEATDPRITTEQVIGRRGVESRDAGVLPFPLSASSLALSTLTDISELLT